MLRPSSLILISFTLTAHASAPDAAAVTQMASQNQQYHQDRLTVEKPTKTASQNQQYHQDRLSVEKPKETASQNQQYHQDRLSVEKPKETASQNQQYHQDRLSVEKPKETASQNQQYHQDRLSVEKPTKVANQNQEYYQKLLELLNTTKGRTADARLKKYLKTYLAQVDGKAGNEHAGDVVKFGGCMIQRLYWNQKFADAKQACGTAVPQVELAHVESCLAQDSNTTSRACVTDAVKGELNRLAGVTSSPRTKFAEAETGSAN